MSDAGGGNSVTGLSVTFDDAGTPIADEATIGSGTFAPSNYEAPLDVLDPPAPVGPFGGALSVFNGVDPDGTWSLYIYDEAGGDSGGITGGWSLSITVALPTVTAPTVLGKTEVGRTLTAQGGTATGAGSTSFQWLRGSGTTFAAIPGATGSTYNLGAADRGKQIKVTQTVTNSEGSASATSNATVRIGPPIVKSLAKRVQRVLKQRGVVVRVKSNLAGSVAARGTVTVPAGAARTLKLKRVTRALVAGRSKRVKLGLSKKNLLAIAQALESTPRLKARVTLVVKDRAGGRTVKKLAIKLKP
jgi:hypothetical protein